MLCSAVSPVFSGGGKTDLNTVTIGGILPLSGPYTVFGREARNGIELAITEINAAGGIRGMQLKLLVEDDEGNPEKTVNAYKKLVSRHKVSIIIGSITSPCTLAITNLAQTQQVILMVPGSTVESIIDAGNFIFRVCFIDTFQGIFGGNFAAGYLGAKKAAVLYDSSNDYSVELKENFEAAFIRGGGSIAVSESYSPGDVDFNPQLTRIKSAGPDVIYLPDYYSTVSLIAKQMRARGIDVPIVGADGWSGLTEHAGDEMLKSFYSDHYDPASEDPGVKEFVGAYKSKYKTLPFSFAVLAYDSLYMIHDAMIRSNSFNAVPIRAALEKTNGRHITGHITFDEGRNPAKSAFMLEIVKSKDGTLNSILKTIVNP
jgi:branched-chain amino acid transport system substrate-binding protein